MAAFFAFFLSGCRSELLPTVTRVDPGAVSEVRNIGNALAESRVEDSWDGETKVTEILIIEMESPTAAEAFKKARDQLKERGWTPSTASPSAYMQSRKWEKTQLSLVSLNLDEPGDLMAEPQVADSVNKALQKAKPEALVVLELVRTDAWQ